MAPCERHLPVQQPGCRSSREPTRWEPLPPRGRSQPGLTTLRLASRHLVIGPGGAEVQGTCLMLDRTASIAASFPQPGVLSGYRQALPSRLSRPRDTVPPITCTRPPAPNNSTFVKVPSQPVPVSNDSHMCCPCWASFGSAARAGDTPAVFLYRVEPLASSPPRPSSLRRRGPRSNLVEPWPVLLAATPSTPPAAMPPTDAGLCQARRALDLPAERPGRARLCGRVCCRPDARPEADLSGRACAGICGCGVPVHDR